MHKSWRLLIISIFITSTVMAVQTGQPAPSFALKDQFGKEWKLSDMKGRVVVVVGADQRSGKAMDLWYERLKSRYGSKILILGLLDLQDIPGIGRGIAKSRIKDETADPMMLDFKGNTSQAYAVSSKCPTIVCIDKGLVVRHFVQSTCTSKAWKSASTAIDTVVK